MAHRESEIAAARLARDNQMAYAKFGAMRRDPSHARRAIVQSSRKRMRAKLSAGVAEFDTDDDEAGTRQVLPNSRVHRVGGAGDGHAATVKVHHRRQRTVDVRATDVQRDVVAVLTSDGRRRSGDAIRVGNAGREGVEYSAYPRLAHLRVREPFLQRSVDGEWHDGHVGVEPELR